MNNPKQMYFLKHHKLLIESIVLHTNLSYTSISSICYKSDPMLSTCIIQPNKSIDIVTVDLFENGRKMIDKEVELAVRLADGKALWATVEFDLEREKIIDEKGGGCDEWFKKTIKSDSEGLEGYIQYKFIQTKMNEINEQTYKMMLSHKNELIVSQSIDDDKEYKRLLEIIEEKNKVIGMMEEQLERVTVETRKLRDRSVEKETMQEKKKEISLNVSVKQSSEIQNQRKRLLYENRELKITVNQKSTLIQNLGRENAKLEKECAEHKIIKKNEQNEVKQSFLQRLQNSIVRSEKGGKNRAKDRKVSLQLHSQITQKQTRESIKLKQEIEKASKLDDIHANKAVLLEKLKNSLKFEKEAQEYEEELNKIHNEMAELKNNYKKDVLAEIEGIRAINEKAIQELTKLGVSNRQQVFAHERQNMSFEMQKLKKSKEEAQIGYKRLEQQKKVMFKEYEEIIQRLHERQVELVKQKSVLQRQLEEVVTFKKQEHFVNEVKNLKEEKEKIANFYNATIANTKKIIDEDSSIKEHQKSVLKDRKENQLLKEEKFKLEDVQIKIKDVQMKQSVIKNNLKQSSFMKPVMPERLLNVDRMILKLNTESEDKPKEQKLVDSMFLKKSSSNNELLGQSGERAREGNNAVQMYTQLSQTAQQWRTKNQQEWSKIIQSTRKQLKQSLEENGKLRVEIVQLNSKFQKQRMDKEREINLMLKENKEKENALEVAKVGFGKEKTALEKKIEMMGTVTSKEKDVLEKKAEMIVAAMGQEKASLEKKIDVMVKATGEQKAKLKLVNEENEKSIKKLQKELTHLNELHNENTILNGQLQSKNKKLLDELNQYERAASKLIEQVQHLNQMNKQTKIEFERLLEERSNAFVHIETIRKVEIEKLIRTKQELEFRMEQEISECMQVKGNNSQMIECNAQLNNQIRAYEEEVRVFKEAVWREKEDFNDKIRLYEEVNLELERNLMTVAEDYAKLEERAMGLEIRNQSLGKQIEVFRNLDGKRQQLEDEWNNKKLEMEAIILYKNEQLRKYETDYMIFQEKLKMVSEENQRMRVSESNLEHLREKIHEKSMEIIRIAEQKSLVIIESTQKQKKIEQLSQSLEEINQHAEQLNLECELLRQKLIAYEGEKSKSLPKVIKRESIKKIEENQQSKYPELESPIVRVTIIKMEDEVEKKEGQNKMVKQNQQSIVQSRVKVLSQTPKRLSLSRLSQKSIRSRGSSRSCSPPKINQRLDVLINERQNELIGQINELQVQRDNLQKLVAGLQLQLENFRPNDNPNDLIKINESVQVNTKEDTVSFGNRMNESLNNTKTQYYEAEMKHLELMVEELEGEKKMLQAALEEEKMNNQKLLQVEEEMIRLNEGYIGKIEELNGELEQRSRDWQMMRKEDEERVQQVVGELFQKDGQLVDALRELDNEKEKALQLQRQLADGEVLVEHKQNTLMEMQNVLKSLKKQYRTYEETSEREIQTLKDRFQQVAAYNKDKDNQLIEMGQKYLSLEEQLKNEQYNKGKLQSKIQKIGNITAKLQEQNKKMLKQKQEYTQSRKILMKRIQEFEIQLLSKHEQINEANKNASFALAKSRIKIQNIEKELQDVGVRQEEKEKVICSLKNEIALYNQECSQLKRGNEDLDYELQRVGKELRDIVVHYESEFKELGREKKDLIQKMQVCEGNVKDKDKILVQLRGEIRESERNRVGLEGELKQLKGLFETYKIQKQREYGQKCNSYQFKNNQLEILKISHQKIIGQQLSYENKLNEERQKYNSLFSEYKAKMDIYEDTLQDLSKQLATLAGGPTKQRWQQCEFENKLLKNRISELDDQLRRKSRAGNQEESIQLEFRKYKVNKEAHVKNLEQEMENYSCKINQLEESNYYLKRESENLRGQLVRMSDDKDELKEEVRLLEEDVEELREEVEFYKAKRREGLNKLLNQTED